MNNDAIELSGKDGWIDGYSQHHLGFATGFGVLQHHVSKLPEGNKNKPMLMMFVQKVRAACKAKNMEALDGWLYALSIGTKSAKLLIPLATTMHETTERVKRVQNEGTLATKEAATQRMACLKAAVDGYLALHPKARGKGPGPLLKNLPRDSDGKVCGYSDKTAERYIGKMLKS